MRKFVVGLWIEVCKFGLDFFFLSFMLVKCKVGCFVFESNVCIELLYFILFFDGF